jgi:hypothetical protein
MANKKVSGSKAKRQQPRKTDPDESLLARFLKLIDPADRRSIQTVAHDLALANKPTDEGLGHVHREWSAGNALAAALTGDERAQHLQRDALKMLSCEARVLEAALLMSSSGKHRWPCDDMDLLHFVKGMAGRAKAAEQMGAQHEAMQRLITGDVGGGK